MLYEGNAVCAKKNRRTRDPSVIKNRWEHPLSIVIARKRDFMVKVFQNQGITLDKLKVRGPSIMKCQKGDKSSQKWHKVLCEGRLVGGGERVWKVKFEKERLEPADRTSDAA